MRPIERVNIDLDRFEVFKKFHSHLCEVNGIEFKTFILCFDNEDKSNKFFNMFEHFGMSGDFILISSSKKVNNLNLPYIDEISPMLLASPWTKKEDGYEIIFVSSEELNLHIRVHIVLNN